MHNKQIYIYNKYKYKYIYMQRTFRLCGLFFYKPKRATVTQTTHDTAQTKQHLYIPTRLPRAVRQALQPFGCPSRKMLPGRNRSSPLSIQCQVMSTVSVMVIKPREQHLDASSLQRLREKICKHLVCMLLPKQNPP